MSAKDLRVVPVTAAEANEVIRRYHYSGKIVRNSQLHLGVYWNGVLEGAMQFGPPMNRRGTANLVAGTAPREVIELNRMAFGPRLPRNSESRALSVALRLLRKHAPMVKWVVSFADGTQCGDGTIYRAAGFVLTSIKRNTTLVTFDGNVVADKSLHDHVIQGPAPSRPMAFGPHAYTAASKRNAEREPGAQRVSPRMLGATPLPGFQLRYVYFLDPTYRARLTVPEVPYARIAEMGARMYRGRAPDA